MFFRTVSWVFLTEQSDECNSCWGGSSSSLMPYPSLILMVSVPPCNSGLSVFSLPQEYLEDQKYRDEEDLAEKLEGLKSKRLSFLPECQEAGRGCVSLGRRV